MTTQEEFAELLVDVAFPDKAGEFNAVERAMDAWDEQARQLRDARTQMYRARQDAYWARQHAHDMTTERARIEDALVRERRRRMSAEGLADERKLLLQEAWAHEQSLMGELERLCTGAPLTAENAARARVVETHTSARAFVFGLPNTGGGALWRFQHGLWRTRDEDVCLTTEQMVALGATVLAWKTA